MKLLSQKNILLTGILSLIFLMNQNELTAQTNNTAQELKTDANGEFITFTSPYMAIACAKDFPMLAYLGVESGGRSRRLLDKSLLRPGLGGTVVSGEQNSFSIKTAGILDKNTIHYNSIPFEDGSNRDWAITASDSRSFNLVVKGNTKFQGEFFKIATAPDVSPVAIWAEKSNETPSDQYDTDEITFYKPEIRKFSWKLPAILHFPDYGLVKVESVDSNVYMQEHFVPDYSNIGLALGPFNRGAHSKFRSYHLGAIILSFHAKENTDEAKITFTVLDENYPQIEGCDFSGSEFDGLKRCWQNAFPVNPQQQCIGDNLLLNGVAHLAMMFKSDMNVFTPDLPGKESMSDAFGRALEKTFTEKVNEETGRLKDYGWESTEISLITLHNYLLATNDWELVYRNLDNIKKVTNSVMDADKDGDGIMESPYHGNRFESNRTSLNWWDDFAFGHKDAYTNLVAYRALKSMQEIYSMLGEKKDVKKIDSFLKRFEEVFHKTFYNPETGVYAGWISEDGKVHDYMFSFINGMAINYGLVEEELAKNILERLLAQMEKEGYDFVYGVPGPTMPVAKEDRQGWEEMSRWGRYENGGLCGQTAYHFIQALYNVGKREKADEILFKMMATFEREYTHSGLFPGYLRSVDWRTKGGAPTGYNYLADNYYFLLAAITGYYGVEFPELELIQISNDKRHIESYPKH